MIAFRLSRAIPVRIHPAFFLVTFLVGWINSSNLPATGIWMAIIFVSVLIHELGHAATALLFGQRVAIEFVALGGLTKQKGLSLPLWKQFLIVLNGPAAGFCLGLAAWQASVFFEWPKGSLGYALLVSMYVNFFWTALNLVPVQPLDGGKLLSIFLEALFGAKGVRAAFFSGFLIGALLGLFFFSLYMPLPGILFFLFGFESFKLWRESKGMTASDRDSLLQALLNEAEFNLQTGNEEVAIKQLQTLRSQAKEGLLYLTATERLAALFLQRGRSVEAFQLLMPLKDSLGREGLVTLHLAAYRLGEWEIGAEAGKKAYQLQPQADLAATLAGCYGRLGQAKPCLGWLRCAKREGQAAVEELAQGPDFDPVRGDPSWRASGWS